MHTCLAIFTHQKNISKCNIATELTDGWVTLIVQILFAEFYAEYFMDSPFIKYTAKRGQPCRACGRSCEKETASRSTVLFQYPRLIFREGLATHLPYENRKAEKTLCTVWSFCVFHISNSRQHAFCTKEQENKYWVLISGRDCTGTCSSFVHPGEVMQILSECHCLDLCSPPC